MKRLWGKRKKWGKGKNYDEKRKNYKEKENIMWKKNKNVRNKDKLSIGANNQTINLTERRR